MKFLQRIKNEGFLGIAPGELKITLVAFAYIFFVICSYYVLKPVRGSLGMELGKDNIPVIGLLSMIVIIASNAVYSVLVGMYRRDIFIPMITKFFVVCIFVFWSIFTFVFPADIDKKGGEKPQKTIAEAESLSVENDEQTLQPKADSVSEKAAIEQSIFRSNLPRALAISVYYLWVGVFALLAVSMFWSFMNDVFSVGQSKRLYAIIGYGGLIGGAVGSMITFYLVPLIGTANLLLVAMVILYPSIWSMKFIHQKHSEVKAEISPQPAPEAPVHPPRPWDGFWAVYRTPILVFMAFEMFLLTFSSTLFYQQLIEMINRVFSTDTDATTEFFAGYFGRITVLSLVSQFFLTRLVMMLPNPVVGLFIFPLIQVVATALMLLSPSLEIVSWGLIISSAISYSTGRAIRELVYVPLDREQKYQGKGFIDTVVFRLGDGLSSIILIGGLELLSYGIWIDWTILLSMAAQFYVIIKIARLFAESLKVGNDKVSQTVT